MTTYKSLVDGKSFTPEEAKEHFTTLAQQYLTVLASMGYKTVNFKANGLFFTVDYNTKTGRNITPHTEEPEGDFLYSLNLVSYDTEIISNFIGKHSDFFPEFE